MNGAEQFEDSRAALRRADMLGDLGRHAEAEALLVQILATDPQNDYAWCLLSHAQAEQGKVDQALQSAKTAISIDPDFEWSYRLASAAYARLGDIDSSIQLAREAVRVAPHEPSVYIRLTYALAQHPNGRNEAFTAANRAVELAPHDPDAYLALAAAAPNKKQSIAACHAALELDPQNAEAHNDLASVAVTGSVFVRPAALAIAAGGFANALRVDPRLRTARINLDLAMRTFLAQVTYAILLDVWFVVHLMGDSEVKSRHVTTAIALVATLVLVWDFVGHLTGSLREYLSRTLTSGRNQTVTALNALAFIMLAVSIFNPAGEGKALVYSALAIAIIGRVILGFEFRDQERAIEESVTNKDSQSA